MDSAQRLDSRAKKMFANKQYVFTAHRHDQAAESAELSTHREMH